LRLRPAVFLLVLASVGCSPASSLAPVAAKIPATVSPAAPLPAPSPTPTPIPELSLASVFGDTKVDLGSLDPSRVRVMIATGDVIPAREVNYKMVLHRDWLYPWRPTADYLHSGDLLFINLETPLIQGCPLMHSGFKFCGDARAIAGLDYAGVSVANLANNHSTNFGPAGTSATIRLLADHHIGVSGLGLWEIRDVRGLKFGFLGFNGIGTHIDRVELKREIDIVRPQVDVLVVAFHWGKEYELLPASAPGIAPDNPRELGHLAIDYGADVVIGNHPHWVEPVEIYRGGFIAYAHGNFIFDQMWSQETREGVVGRYTFYDSRLIRVDYRPVLIDDWAQPHFLDDTQGEGLAIIDRMAKASQALAPASPAPRAREDGMKTR
jgi:poly-gamma-glutamate capsule biosynthesis protein CapA/YwtB (metallophosphatase superfamily)